MSVASEISRITSLRNRIRDKLILLGLLPSTPQQTGGNDLYDCTEAIEDIAGTQSITTLSQYDVAGVQYAQVNDSNLVSQNIAEGVTILGITGTHSGSTPPQQTQSKTMYLGGPSAPATVYPDSGYLLSSVDPGMVSQPTLLPENIKSGVTIMGVTGTYGVTFDFSVNIAATATSISIPVPFSSLRRFVSIVVYCSAIGQRVDGDIITLSIVKDGSSYYCIVSCYGYEVAMDPIPQLTLSNGVLTISNVTSANTQFITGNNYYYNAVFNYTTN